MRILIIEDDPTLRRAITRVMRCAGFACTVASNHAMGALCLSHTMPPYQMVISDYDLGDGTGDTLLARARELHPRAFLVLHTANGSATCPEAHTIVLKDASSVGVLLHLAQNLSNHFRNELST